MVNMVPASWCLWVCREYVHGSNACTLLRQPCDCLGFVNAMVLCVWGGSGLLLQQGSSHVWLCVCAWLCCACRRGGDAAGAAAQRCVAQCVAVLVVQQGPGQVQDTVQELLTMLKADAGGGVGNGSRQSVSE